MTHDDVIFWHILPLVAVKGIQILYAISGDQKSLSDRGLSKAIFRAQKQCDPIYRLLPGSKNRRKTILAT